MESRKNHLGLEVKKDYIVRELIDWYLELPDTLKVKSLPKIRQHCRTLKAYFGNNLTREIKPYMIEEYLQKRLNQRTRRGDFFKPASVNREFEVLKRFFNIAIREDILDKNPCLKVIKLKEDNARDRILSHEEFLMLTKALPSHAADIVRMGYYTGMRFGEIVGLSWDRVNLDQGCIRLEAEDTKTKHPRIIYMVPQALEVLERTSKVRGISHNQVFLYLGKPVKSIKVALKNALEKTGIKDFRFHDLRHTFNTNMRKAGVDRSVIMKFTGHKTLSMFLRYSTVDENDAREAVEKFNDFLVRGSEITSNSTSRQKKRLRNSA